MPKINVLDKHISELIAAGQVVERPCAAVKELLENSIDAGADRIVVEIKNGGNKYIRVMDNGCGIEKDDLPKAFLRHATSKISSESDLEKIMTLGFRGEALAAIATVSHIKIISRTNSSFTGYCCEATDGEIGEVYESGCPKGTSVIVEDIFYNTPARQKFLKKDVAEGNAISGIVNKLALSHPEIQIRFIKNGEVSLESRGTGDLLLAIEDVMGREFAKDMIKVDYVPFGKNNYRISGYITKPTACRASRNYQNFFVNGRFAKLSMGSTSIESAFSGSVMSGKYPGCVLNIEAPPEMVDVNVHPTKAEVRFASEKEIFDLIYYGVKTALQEKDDSKVVEESKKINKDFWSRLTSEEEKNHFEEVVRQTTLSAFMKPEFLQNIDEEADVKYDLVDYTDEEIKNRDNATPYRIDGDITHTVQYQIQQAASLAIEHGMELSQECKEGIEALKEDGAPLPQLPKMITGEDFPLGKLKYIGELFKTYILLESPDELIFIDKHAAHERILYNKLRAKTKAFDCQYVTPPITVNLSEEQCEAVTENYQEMERFGFIVGEFGRGTVIVRSLPFWLKQSEAEEVITEIADSLLSCKHDITPEKLDKLYASISCRAAIKAHDKNSTPELETIVNVLLNDPKVKYCPHGRPVSTSITKSKLEKMFGRIQ